MILDEGEIPEKTNRKRERASLFILNKEDNAAVKLLLSQEAEIDNLISIKKVDVNNAHFRFSIVVGAFCELDESTICKIINIFRTYTGGIEKVLVKIRKFKLEKDFESAKGKTFEFEFLGFFTYIVPIFTVDYGRPDLRLANILNATKLIIKKLKISQKIFF